MPYIIEPRREVLDPKIDELVAQLKAMNAQDGDYNYTITRILASGLDVGKNPKYSKINKIIGVLECIKLELYRRIANRYEEDKKITNGDVLEYEHFDKREVT